MIERSRIWLGEPSTWLALFLCCGLCALAWFGTGSPMSGSAVRYCSSITGAIRPPTS